MSVLENVNSPKDIKKLSNSELDELCSDIRGLLVETVSQTGGHLASNLGVVELTVALHRRLSTLRLHRNVTVDDMCLRTGKSKLL